MITFRLAKHDIRDVAVVQIFNGDVLLGVLYPQTWGVRLVSKYLVEESVDFDPMLPPAINVRLP